MNALRRYAQYYATCARSHPSDGLWFLLEWPQIKCAARWVVEQADAEFTFEFLLSFRKYLEEHGLAKDLITWGHWGLHVAELSSDRRRAAEFLNMIGYGAVCVGNTALALHSYSSAWNMAQEIGDPRLQSSAAGGIANVHSQLTGKTDEAFAHYKAAYTLAKDAGDMRLQAVWLANSGALSATLLNAEAASNDLALALRLAQEVGDLWLVSLIVGNLGTMEIQRSQFSTIANGGSILDVPVLNPQVGGALETLTKLGDLPHKSVFLSNIAEAQMQRGDFASAVKLLEEAVEIARSKARPQDEVRCLYLLGGAHSAMAEHSTSDRYFTAALSLSRELANPYFEVGVLLSKGITYRTGKRYQMALEAFQSAVRLSREIGYIEGLRDSLAGESFAHGELKDITSAISCAQEALALAELTAPAFQQASLLTHLGLWYSDLNKPHEALDYFTRALVLYVEADSLGGQRLVLKQLGAVCRELGSFEAALGFDQRALDISERTNDPHSVAYTLKSLGKDLLALGKSTKAEDFLRRSLKVAMDNDFVDIALDARRHILLLSQDGVPGTGHRMGAAQAEGD